MTRAVIDLGTNTVLMAIGSKEASGTITILGDYHQVGRLGKGVDESGKIMPETFERIGTIFQRYSQLAHEHGAESISAYGTSALRDASNRDDFIVAMKEVSDVDLFLLSGLDEARLTWEGALFGFPPDQREVIVLDIGGGSTEIARGKNALFSEGISLDVGAVRVTERFFQNTLPPSSEAVRNARSYCRNIFQEVDALPEKKMVVGVAGTVSTLGAIHQGVERFDADEINGTPLSYNWIHQKTEELLSLPLEALRAIPQITKGRADVISGGALVLDVFMEVFDVEEIIVSTRGVRYGLLKEAFEGKDLDLRV